MESGFIYCAIWVSSCYFVDNVSPVTQNSIMQIIYFFIFLVRTTTALSFIMYCIMPFIAVNTALLLMTLRLTEWNIGYLSSDHCFGGRTSKILSVFCDRVTHSTWIHSVRFTSYIIMSTGLEWAGWCLHPSVDCRAYGILSQDWWLWRLWLKGEPEGMKTRYTFLYELKLIHM